MGADRVYYRQKKQPHPIRNLGKALSTVSILKYSCTAEFWKKICEHPYVFLIFYTKTSVRVSSFCETTALTCIAVSPELQMTTQKVAGSGQTAKEGRTQH